MTPSERYPPPPDQDLDHGRVRFRAPAESARISRAPKGYQRPDARIGEDIDTQLARLSQIDLTNVSFRVEAGRVQLEGTVPERWMKHAIEDISSECFGVQEVENRIMVSPDRRNSSA